MRQTAKLFMNGRSQAVRLPAIFRFDCDEVFISRYENTGNVIISKKPGSWDDFFKLVDITDIPTDFMSDRDNEPPQERDIF
jgi:antitoxin VapB